MRNAFIVSAVRLPTGKFLGTLKDFTAPELGAMVVREAVARAGIDPAIVDECIMGNVVSGGVGQAPARQAALKGGLADHVAALTINKVCGSGLKAVMLAQQGIQTGDIDIAVAGGMESMSNCPYIIPKVREGLRMGHGQVIDSDDPRRPVVPVRKLAHGQRRRDRRRRLQGDARSAGSVFRRQPQEGRRGAGRRQVQRRDPAGRDPAEEGRPAGRSTSDESVRGDTTAEVLRALKPAFKKDGSVTAGNAPPVNDGAAALVVMADDTRAGARR